MSDAQLMASILEEKFGFHRGDVNLLIDEQATKDNILDAFDDLIGATAAGDVAVIYFAGHGSRLNRDPRLMMRRVTKASGYNTALCPVDVMEGPDLHYLFDEELHERLLDLAHRTSFITVVIDACHSATVTRDLFGDRIRSAPPIDLPNEAFEIHRRPRRYPAPSAPSFSTGPSGWLSLSDSYVLIAGCRDEEVSNEFSPDPAVSHGALTFFLAQELRSAHSGMSYRDVFERAAANVTAKKPLQHPQLEGRVDRAVFGVHELLPMDFAKVLSRTGDRVRLNRGAAHGMTPGSVYEVHEQGAKRLPSVQEREAGAPTDRGTVEIMNVDAFETMGRITGESATDANSLQTLAHLRSPHARDLHEDDRDRRCGPSGWRLPATVTKARRCAGRARGVTPLLESCAGASNATNATAFARAYLIDARGEPTGADPVPQAWPPRCDDLGGRRHHRSAAHAGQARSVMSSVIRERSREDRSVYSRRIELKNEHPASLLNGRIGLDILRRDRSGNWIVATPDRAGGLPVFEEGDAVAFRIDNHSNKPAYINLLDFQPGYALEPFYPPSGATEMIPAGGLFEQGTVPPGHPDEWTLQANFSDDEVEQVETLKLFATDGPADFSILKQDRTRDVPGEVTRAILLKNAA